MDRIKKFAVDFKDSFTGKIHFQSQTIDNDTYVFEKLLDQTLQLPEKAFQIDMLFRDPIFQRIPQNEWMNLIQKSEQIGIDYASKINTFSGNWENLFAKYQINYKEMDIPTSPERVLFAQFVEPDELTVFTDTIKKYAILNKEKWVPDYMDASTLKNTLLAHELFHFFEFHDKKTIATKNYQIITHKLGIFKLKAVPISMSEIAAMSFAKRYLQLSFSPNVFDILLVYLYSPVSATNILKRIQKNYRIMEEY